MRSQRRAVEIAQAWVDQWVAAGPNEAEAYLMASRVYELAGEDGAALDYLDTAESLGVESDMENRAGRRVALLAKLGRFDAAVVIADSLLDAGYFRSLLARMPFNFPSAVWATQVYLLTGKPDKAGAVAGAHGGIRRLCGLEPGEFRRIEIPDTLDVLIADAVVVLERNRSERPLVRECLAYALLGVAARAGRPELVRPAFDNLIGAREFDTAVEVAGIAVNSDTTVAGRLAVLEQLRRIVEIDAANLDALYQIGRIGALTGQELDLARASLEEYLRHPPAEGLPHAAAQWRLGMIHEHRGDVDRAREAYEASLRLDPEYGPPKAALERLPPKQ